MKITYNLKLEKIETATGTKKLTQDFLRNIENYTYDVMECDYTYKFVLEAFYNEGFAIKVSSQELIINPKKLTSKLLPLTYGAVKHIGKDSLKILMSSESLGLINSIEKYTFYKSDDGGKNFLEAFVSNNNTYNDLEVDTQKKAYCYRAKYTDKCGNESQLSDAFCSMLVTAEQPKMLNWTPAYINYPTTDKLQVEYRISLKSSTGTVIEKTTDVYRNVSTFINQELSKQNSGKVTFVIAADIILANNARQPITSSEYTFIADAEIYIPNVFTPNGDNNNDIFLAKGQYFSDFKMLIFDRWSRAIFESDDIKNGWDGKLMDGTDAQIDNYAYKILGMSEAGHKYEKKGSVLLLR
jgi:gliding motility-associated-like protein